MAALQILCPNGRRQNVKINPNTKLLQVLEEVCKKQGFLPPEDYNLIHGRKILDVTLSIRFAGLANNAKLELVKSQSSRSEQDVLIALQLENGERLQEKFHPSKTLWDVLMHWETQKSEMQNKLTNVDDSMSPSFQPVCIYMREEVIGCLALQSTSLRSLGLTGGKTVIRHSHRQVDDELLAAIIEKIEKEKAKNIRLDEMAAKQSSASEEATERSNVPWQEAEAMEVDSNTSQHRAGQSEEAMNVELQNSLTRDESKPCAQQESIGTTNGVSARPRQNEGEMSAAEALRGIPGVEVITPQDFLNLTPEEQEIGRRLAASYMFSVGLSEGQNAMRESQRNTSEPQKNKMSRPIQNVFENFKFPEETKGKELYKNELSNISKDDYQPCERETVLFNLEESLGTLSEKEDLPESFFEVTEGDIKRMMKDLHKKVEDFSDQPLLTKTLKQALKEEKYSKYERVVIRVQFPSKLVLQGLFRPQETVFSLCKYVKEHLKSPEEDFYLYTSPPKTVLSDNSQTLIQADLVPASVVYFGAKKEQESDFLNEGVKKDIKSRIDAEKVANKWFENVCPTQSSAEPSTRNMSAVDQKSSSKPSSSPASATASSSLNKRSPANAPPTGDSGVPKWFKIGKK